MPKIYWVEYLQAETTCVTAESEEDAVKQVEAKGYVVTGAREAEE